jgi:hypothetical protein
MAEVTASRDYILPIFINNSFLRQQQEGLIPPEGRRSGPDFCRGRIGAQRRILRAKGKITLSQIKFLTFNL